MASAPSSTSRNDAILAPVYVAPEPTILGAGKGWVVTLIGTAAEDVFDPGTGIGGSTMIGNGGNDVFYVHSGHDKVVVAAGLPGRSTVIVDSMNAYTLPDNVANLVAGGSGSIALTGNGLANILRANGAGDTLDGGGGNDTLVGGAGRDSFVDAVGDGSDMIVGFQAAGDGDVVKLGNGAFASFGALQAAMTQTGADVVLTLGGGETLTFTGHKIADFTAADFGLPATTPTSGNSGGGGGTAGPPATATTHAPAIPQPDAAGEIVGLNLQNPGTTALASREITFGQEFGIGQVPAGRLLIATIDGVTIPVQMDVKTTYPDGSVGMAILTLVQPGLAAGATDGVMLALAPAVARAGAPVDIAGLGAAGYDLTVDLTLTNADDTTTPFHLDAAKALAAALKAGTASYWLKGPQATQVRIDVPVSGSLRLTLDITAYADGTTSTDVQFNNDIAMGATGGEVKYDTTIRQGGGIAFQQSGIDQFQYQTWHKVVASNGAPAVNVQHDVAALESAGFVQNYDLASGVATSIITGEVAQMTAGGRTVTGTPSFGVLGNAGVTQYMPTTGGRADIGPTTLANTAWLMTQDAGAASYALAQADAAGSIPWHLYSIATGTYLTAAQYPTLWADGRGGTTGGTTGLTQPLPASGAAGTGWNVDPAHQPDLSYDAYLLTGSRYYLDQLNAQTSYDILAQNPDTRGKGQGLVVNGQAQVRTQAWDLREIAEAALVNPDGSTAATTFDRALDANFANLIKTLIPAADATEGAADGWLPGAYGNPGNMAPWQQDYFGQVVVMAAEQGDADAASVLHWEANFLVGRFLQATAGFDPHDGVAYNLVVGPSTGGALYQSWDGIESATAAAGLAANFSDGWQELEYISYRSWALATLAGDITVEQSPAAIQAYGWLVANAGITAATRAASPQYDIVPRLSDEKLLSAANIHVLTGTTGGNAGFGDADSLVYDLGTTGNTTITGGSGIDMLFAGGGSDVLIGGAGDDYLFGGSGADTLSGGTGGNWLQAGGQATRFDFNVADAATDIVAGFVPGRDHLHITAAGGAPLGQTAIAAIVDGGTTRGNDTILKLGATHTVTVQDVAPAQLIRAVYD